MALSEGAERLRRFLAQFLIGPGYVPYDNIARIDSRAWDPNWKYRDKYMHLARVMNFGLNNSSKAYSVASGESYMWGRSGRPVAILAQFDKMGIDAMIKRIRALFTFQDSFIDWLRRARASLRGREQWEDPMEVIEMY